MIPLYLHVPRCGGTYIVSCFDAALHIINRPFDTLRPRRIEVMMGGEQIMTAWVSVPVKSQEKRFDVIRLGVFDFIVAMPEMSIFAISLEPDGIYLLKDGIIKIFDNIFPFCVLRNPIERIFSHYNYISSSESQHERTHLAFKSSSFEDHIFSEQLEDSWLIRNLLSIPSRGLNDEDYNEACNILDIFNIRDIKNVDDIFSLAIWKCYGLTLDDAPDRYVEQNRGPQKEMYVSEGAMQAFEARALYDIMLYERFCKHAN